MSAFNDWCTPGPNLECRPYGSNVSDVDPDRLITPFEGVNYTGCDEDMQLSDFDGDGRISNVEYASFVQKTAARRCNWWPELNLGQKNQFHLARLPVRQKRRRIPRLLRRSQRSLGRGGSGQPDLTNRTAGRVFAKCLRRDVRNLAHHQLFAQGVTRVGSSAYYYRPTRHAHGGRERWNALDARCRHDWGVAALAASLLLLLCHASKEEKGIRRGRNCGNRISRQGRVVGAATAGTSATLHAGRANGP
mmetsp:Transcript_22186/g.61645  ORF Transcript_22186/g.61645 Transcript_22186/m.61645 type:complete len:248 (-) Transcript_22186:1096-1839(-)